jgi:hypothetical protein
LGGKNKIIKPSYGTSCSSFFSNNIFPSKIKALKSFNNFSKLTNKKRKLHQSSTNQPRKKEGGYLLYWN